MRCYSIVPPCGCRLISQAGPPLGHFFQIAWTDSESRPRPPDVRIEIQDRSRRHTSPLGHTPIDAWIQKMDVDGDGGRREFGLRGQRRGTESDMGTAANSSASFSTSAMVAIRGSLVSTVSKARTHQKT